MKKSNLLDALCAGVLVSALGMGLAQASVLAPDTTYNMFIRIGTSCYAAGTDCTTLLSHSFTDNGVNYNLNGTTYGSSIGGDGWAGVVRFRTDTSGDNYTVLSYNLDQYPHTPPDVLVSWADSPELMTGTVDSVGNMTLMPTGRMALASFFADSIGVQPWNIDDSPDIPAPTNALASYTTGTSTGQVLTGSPSSPIILTGSTLASDGSGGWDAELVSSSNFGSSWGLFSGTGYTEVWDVSIQAVPVPAAAWLFGSGLLGLIGLVKRKA